MEFFKPPGPIAFDSSNLDEAWRSWEQQFRTFFTACELTNKPKEVQVAILLHTAGPEAQEVFNQFVMCSDQQARKTTRQRKTMTIGKQCWISFAITVNRGKIRFTKGIVSGHGTREMVN